MNYRNTYRSKEMNGAGNENIRWEGTKFIVGLARTGSAGMSMKEAVGKLKERDGMGLRKSGMNTEIKEEARSIPHFIFRTGCVEGGYEFNF